MNDAVSVQLRILHKRWAIEEDRARSERPVWAGKLGLVMVTAGLSVLCAPAAAQLNACDLAAPYGTIDSADVTAAIDMSLGLIPCTANIVGSKVCDVVVVQRVINASSGGPCLIGSHSVDLTWKASISSNVIGYNVYRKTPWGRYTKLNSSPIAATKYTDHLVGAGRTYYYVTTAVNSSAQESGYSNEVKVAIPWP